MDDDGAASVDPRYAAVSTAEPLGGAPHLPGDSDADASTGEHEHCDSPCSSSSFLSEEDVVVVSEEDGSNGEHHGSRHHDCEIGDRPLLAHSDEDNPLKEMPSRGNEGIFESLPSAWLLCVGLMLASASAAAILTALVARLSGSGGHGIFGGFHLSDGPAVVPEPRPFPPELLDRTTGAYKETDFVNSEGRMPPFWDNIVEQLADNDDENVTLSHHWGPCLPSLSLPSSSKLNWTRLVKQNRKRRSDADLRYPKYNHNRPRNEVEATPWGLCRPGFIIIGAGKCGTSSLYHYLVGHDRVLPAREKQIHYFKYHAQESMSWYLSHFVSTETFLASGALMTGEASPGYLPYPPVAIMAASRLPGPKIITIAREPLDRAWSSYKYNYVTPALERAMKGRLWEKGVPHGKSEEYYRENHLFSFEEMLRAELVVLKDCLRAGGTGETASRKVFSKKKWARDEFLKRDQEGLPPLIDLDEHCYGKRVSRTVPRAQWSDLIDANPEKIIHLPNMHLVQSFIGRGLYTLPLEWWYITYPAEDHYLVCNEDMREDAAQMVGDLSKWLGLPDFDFTDVVSEGMYNVAGHRGYDLAVPWNETDTDFVDGDNFEEGDDFGEGETSPDGNGDEKQQSQQEKREAAIPISDELREEILDFVRPYNERLFELTGRRCNWL